MDNRTKKIKMVNSQNRCEFSGEAIGKKPAVLVKNVIEYVKKMGYLVSNIKFLWIFIFITLLIPTFFAIQSSGWFDSNPFKLPHSGICEFNNLSINNSFLVFDDVNDGIDINDDLNLSYFTSNFTFSFWIYKGPLVEQYADVFRSSSWSANGNFASYILDDDTFKFNFKNSSGSQFGRNINNFYANYGEKWTHLAFTSNFTNLCSYVNGVYHGCTDLSGDLLTDSDSTLIIGDDMGASLDEIRIYNISLSYIQILEINNSGRIENVSLGNNGLLLWYPMNEGSGSIIYDKSGNNYDGV